MAARLQPRASPLLARGEAGAMTVNLRCCTTARPRCFLAAPPRGAREWWAAGALRKSVRTQRKSSLLAAAAASPSAAPISTTPAPAAPAEPALRTLYPAAAGTPLRTGHLRVSPVHELYYEVHGRADGIPALCLHGGPGAGAYANHARFFDPQRYCVVLFDQRGCGRSTPRGCLAGNDTAALVADAEALRAHLGVPRWLVLGGSWGATLALALAQAHPSAVLGLVLRGVCLMRPSEVAWMYGGDGDGGAGAGAAALRPLSWAAFVAGAVGAGGADGERYRRAPLLGYYERLLSSDPAVRDAATKAFLTWDLSVGFTPSATHLALRRGDGDGAWSAHEHPSASNGAGAPLTAPPTPPADADAAPPLPPLQRGSSNSEDTVAAPTPPNAAAPPPLAPGLPCEGANVGDAELAALLQRGLAFAGDARMPPATAQALLTAHYSVHAAFLLRDPLLRADNVRRLIDARIPCVAVHGAADLVCPPSSAAALAAAFPAAEVRVVPGAGHSMYDPRIVHELLLATDRFADALEGAVAPATL